MQSDEVLQATLLLSCYFNKSEVKHIKPLTPTEYARFAAWLHMHKLTPADLLHDQSGVMGKWHDHKGKITAERINILFSRGASMGFALEQWNKHGVWVIARSNQKYPQRLKSKIGDTRPPIFFGVGNQELLNQKGIGFVGSRSIDTVDEAFARAKAEVAVSQGYTVISGGAKGIDQTAMCAALACGGESVGIMADGLLRSSTAKAYRQGLKENRLALISPFYPEAGFNAGNAMARNKYIYAMSEAVVVTKSDFNKGGTWSGAKENLSKRWVPLLVRDAAYEGNQELIKLGGLAIDESFDDFNQLPSQIDSTGQLSIVPYNDTAMQETSDMFGSLVEETNTTKTEIAPEPAREIDSADAKPSLPDSVDTTIEAPEKEIESDSAAVNSMAANEYPGKQEGEQAATENGELNGASPLDEYGEIFSLFYNSVRLLGDKQGEISSALMLEQYPELTKALVDRWLKLLASEGYLEKEGRKLVYKLTSKAIV